jgi:transcriptional regulator with XRE-family HTH domain
MKKFGEIVRETITEKKLTLAHVAKGMSSHKGYVSGICTRTLNPPSPRMIRKLCEILDLDYDHMLALAVFEKLPKGLRYEELRLVLVEADSNQDGVAPGGLKGWRL